MADRVVSQRGHLDWEFAQLLGVLGSGAVVGVVAVAMGVVLWRRGRRTDGWIVVASTAAAGVLTELVKAVVTRPATAVASIPGSDAHGYPSGHVSGFVAFATAVFLISRPWRARTQLRRRAGSGSTRDDRPPTVLTTARVVALKILLIVPLIVLLIVPLIVMVLVVMAGRIVVEAHTASDTVGGALLGLAVVLIVTVAVEASRRRDRPDTRRRSPPLGTRPPLQPEPMERAPRNRTHKIRNASI